MRYSKEFTIYSYSSNRYGNASLASVFNFLIEIAWEHAQKLDWGFDELKSNNLFWVLSRVYIHARKYPKWQDKIKVETWPTGTDGVYAFREFAVKNEQGEVIISASSSWLILDLDTKRIIRPNSLSETFRELAQNKICRYPEKIRPHKEKGELFFAPVLFTDLDINQHFNSVKYVERALNYLGIEFLNNHEVDEIEVNYLKEGMPEDAIAVSAVQKTKTESLISLVRKADLADLCTMKITWRTK